MTALRRLPATAALAAVAATLAGCGSASTKPQGGGTVTPVNHSGSISFPDLGYRKEAPRLPAHLSPGAVVVVDMANTGAVQPAQMALALGADASGLRWSSWGAATATGRGTATVRICTPNCGAGYNRQYPAKVTLTDVRACDRHRFYERATVALSTPTPSKPWPAVLKNPC